MCSCQASSFHGAPLTPTHCCSQFLSCCFLRKGSHTFLTPYAQASGATFSVFLYYLPLLAAGSAFVQQVLSVPFWNGSFATHIMRKCSHFVACLFVCSSSWLSISKFHYSMFNDGAWREDSCSNENGGALGVEFLLHLSSAFMYFCMSSSNWLPSAARSDSQNHDHDE